MLILKYNIRITKMFVEREDLSRFYTLFYMQKMAKKVVQKILAFACGNVSNAVLQFLIS